MNSPPTSFLACRTRSIGLLLKSRAGSVENLGLVLIFGVPKAVAGRSTIWKEILRRGNIPFLSSLRGTRVLRDILIEKLYLEDLCKGDHWVSPSQTITREHVIRFAELTGDHDPLHVDEEFASKSAFRQPIAHGLLGLSIMAGLSSKHPMVHTIAFTELDDWQFKHPIFFGDTVHVETEIVAIQPYGRRAGKVTWFRQLVNQNGQVVQQGSLDTIVAARQPRKSKRTDRTTTKIQESV